MTRTFMPAATPYWFSVYRSERALRRSAAFRIVGYFHNLHDDGTWDVTRAHINTDGELEDIPEWPGEILYSVDLPEESS